jgi:hypothetical protein
MHLGHSRRPARDGPPAATGEPRAPLEATLTGRLEGRWASVGENVFVFGHRQQSTAMSIEFFAEARRHRAGRAALPELGRWRPVIMADITPDGHFRPLVRGWGQVAASLSKQTMSTKSAV